MDYSHILRTAVPQKNKLLEYGFTAEENGFSLKINIPQTDFYAVIKIEPSEVTAHVYESDTDERYALFDVVSASGAFVGELREKVELIINDIHTNCFAAADLYSDYVEYLKETFACEQDFPWKDSASVFRCESGKWFALLMEISFRSLGFDSEEKVWAVNLKTDPELIPILVDNKSIFPAYHMNKKYWVTVLLTAVTDLKKLKALTEESYYLVDRKN